MLQEKAGNIAGIIWNALSEAQTSLTFKQIKKTTKLIPIIAKDFFEDFGKDLSKNNNEKKYIK